MSVEPDSIEPLRAERLAWYAEPVVEVEVPHPAKPLGEESAGDTSRLAVGCVLLGIGVFYFANLVDVAVSTGNGGLAGGARVALAGCLIAVPFLWWYVKRRAGIAFLDGPLARPWIDLREGLRLGSVEPANPAWGVALAHGGRMQEQLRRVTRYGGSRHATEVQAEVQAAGALVWATSEAWRREQQRLPKAKAVSPLERLPLILGRSLEEAAHASDEAADAATEALGMGNYDLDFTQFARRRAGMYARASSGPVACIDPTMPLPNSSVRRRRTAETSFVVLLVSAALAGLLLAADHPWWSLLACVPALTAVALVLLRPPEALPDTVDLPAGLGMAWQDYLSAVTYVDSGVASVPTVEAVRSCEQRIRAILVELTSPTRSPVEEAPLASELFRLCSQAWTLFGQEVAEQRLLEEGEATP